MKWAKIILIIGVLGLAVYYFLPEEPDLGVVPPCVAVNDIQKCMVWTDDNTNETLVIRSDWGVKHGIMGMVRIHFSVTNNSNTQNVRFLITAPDKWELRDLLKNDGTRIADIPAVTRVIPASATSTEQVIVVREAYSETQTIWTDLIKKPATSKSNLLRKPVQGKPLGENDVMDNIKTGETKFYSASFYTNDQDGEFFIEAFGDAGAYGHLDPTAFNASDNFESYADEAEMNGQTGGTGWSAGWVTTVSKNKADTSNAYEGTVSVESTAASPLKRTISSAMSEGSMYVANLSNGSGGWYQIPSSGGADTQYITINAVGGNITIYDANPGNWTSICTYSNDVWYPLNIEWDAAVSATEDCSGSDCTRARCYASGSWGSFSNWKDSNAAYSTIDTAYWSPTGTGSRVDTYCGSDITTGGCAESAAAPARTTPNALPGGFFY